MKEIERILVESREIFACKEYISDGVFLVNKRFINSKALLFLETLDKDLCKVASIPYEKGIPINETPFLAQEIKIYRFFENESEKIKINENILKPLTDLCAEIPGFYIVDVYKDNEYYGKFLKIFDGDEFIGGIMEAL